MFKKNFKFSFILVTNQLVRETGGLIWPAIYASRRYDLSFFLPAPERTDWLNSVVCLVTMRNST